MLIYLFELCIRAHVLQIPQSNTYTRLTLPATRRSSFSECPSPTPESQHELRTGLEAVHHVLGAGFVFLGPGGRVSRQTQQERQPGGYEELQLGQHVEN